MASLRVGDKIPQEGAGVWRLACFPAQFAADCLLARIIDNLQHAVGVRSRCIGYKYTA
jgi:hypothetical protein